MTERPDAATYAELLALETSLWVAATRYDQDHLERTFHPDFTEVGQSGRQWTRAEAMAIPPRPDGEIPIELPLTDVTMALVGPGVALVRYRSRTEDGTQHRTSVWQRAGDRWRLRFHQGTPAAPAAD